MGRPSKWSPEFREEAVRLCRESGESVAGVARRLGLGPETLRKWVRRDEVERGERDGLTIAEHAEIRELRRQVRRLEEEKLILQSCISTIKNELVKRRTFRTRDQARLALFRYIEGSTTRSAATPALPCSAPTTTNADTERTTPQQQPPPRRTVSMKTGQPQLQLQADA